MRAERGEQMDKHRCCSLDSDPARLSNSGEMLTLDDVLEILSIVPLLGVIPEIARKSCAPLTWALP